MAYKVPPFLRKDGSKLLFNQSGEFVFYIPEIYFDRGIAEVVGDYISTIGIMNYAIFNEAGKHSGLKTFKYPTKIECKPSKMEKVKGIKLLNTTKVDDYRVLHFYKDDEVIANVFSVEDVDNIDKFMKMFMTGKLPNTIKADELQNYFIDNGKLNGTDYGLSIALFGIMLSESLRSPSNPNVLYRHTDMKDMTNYDIMNIKDIPKHINPYTAITSENWLDASTAAMTSTNTKPVPMERLMV